MFGALTGALLLIGQVPTASPRADSRWSLRIDAARCLLQREITDQLSTLVIETTPGSDSYRMVLVSKHIKGSGSLVPASLTFGPGQQVLNGLASTGKLLNGTSFLRLEGLPPALLDHLASAETVAIATEANSMGIISVPNAAKAVAAFRKCSADQLIEWGADASQFEPGGQAPIASKDRDQWISGKDFMALANQSHQTDVDATFRVSISTTGVIENCQVMDEGIEKGVEKVACSVVVNKPLFAPARDASGAPVRGVATFRVIMARRPS